MKHLKFLMAFAAIAIPFLLAACSDSSETPSDKTAVTETVCVDDKTGLEMPCDVLKALKDEREKREAAEAAAVSNRTDAGSQTATNETGIRNGFFEEKELGFRIPVQAWTTIEKREIPPLNPNPPEPTRDMEPSIGTDNAIGYYAVQTSPGPMFTIVVERWDEDNLLDENGRAIRAPGEGGLSPNTLDMPNGLKGYLYLGNAMGFVHDAHITVYRRHRIYYLREVGTQRRVSEALKFFAKTFEVLE